MHTMKKFIRYYAPYKAVFFLDLICAAVISLVDLAFPQIFTYAYEDVVYRISRSHTACLASDWGRIACNLYITGAL